MLDRFPHPSQALLIGRRDRRSRLVWALPKGHVEPGETLAQTALREVQEETGIAAEVVAPLGVTDYWFVWDGRRIHKTVHFFVMVFRAGALSTSDPEVERVAWVGLSALQSRLHYPDDRALVAKLDQVLAEASA